MAANKEPVSNRPRRPPATTPQARENQMVALAYDLAEKQMRDGSASSQVMSQFLKLGTMQHKLELEELRQKNLLAEARIKSMASSDNIEKMYGDAMKAFSSYQGNDESYED